MLKSELRKYDKVLLVDMTTGKWQKAIVMKEKPLYLMLNNNTVVKGTDKNIRIIELDGESTETERRVVDRALELKLIEVYNGYLRYQQKWADITERLFTEFYEH